MILHKCGKLTNLPALFTCHLNAAVSIIRQVHGLRQARSLPRRVSLVSLVTAMTFIDTNYLNVKEARAGWKGRFFHSQNMTFAYYAVTAGAWIHEHSHPNDEVWNVIDGELEIKIAAETQVAGPGCAVVVPPDTAHSVKALTDVRAIVVDYPRRYSIGGTEL